MTFGLTAVEENGLRVVEGAPEVQLITRPQEASRVIEACLSHRILRALLYATNLSDKFFDLSSGEAGEILQKLRNYRIRLAVVCPQGSVKFSSHFCELVAEEQMRHQFGVFESRRAARKWLAQS